MSNGDPGDPGGAGRRRRRHLTLVPTTSSLPSLLAGSRFSRLREPVDEEDRDGDGDGDLPHVAVQVAEAAIEDYPSRVMTLVVRRPTKSDAELLAEFWADAGFASPSSCFWEKNSTPGTASQGDDVDDEDLENDKDHDTAGAPDSSVMETSNMEVDTSHPSVSGSKGKTVVAAPVLCAAITPYNADPRTPRGIEIIERIRRVSPQLLRSSTPSPMDVSAAISPSQDHREMGMVSTSAITSPSVSSPPTGVVAGVAATSPMPIPVTTLVSSPPSSFVEEGWVDARLIESIPPHCGRGSGFGYYITSTDPGCAFFTDPGYISFTDPSSVSFTDSGCVSFIDSDCCTFGAPGD
ncbi:hypothetical protein ACQ4PT_051630 [Festuca glaucescens]